MYSSKQNRIPDFYIVGAAKSGTSSLWYYLGQHPDIFLTKDIHEKELGYFSNDYGISDLKQYASYFSKAKDNQIIGEACHAYLSSPESAELIKSFNSNAKIIIIVRNPVERAISLYNWMVKYGYENLPFKKAIKREEIILKNKETITSKFRHTYFRNYLYLTSGLYYKQISNYLNVFPRNNVKIILNEELKASPKHITIDILKFLGIENLDVEINYTFQNVIKTSYRSQLQYFAINHIPYYLNKIRCPYFIIKIIRSLFLKLAIRNHGISISEDIYKNIQSFFIEDIIKTSDLINKDLKDWIVK